MDHGLALPFLFLNWEGLDADFRDGVVPAKEPRGEGGRGGRTSVCRTEISYTELVEFGLNECVCAAPEVVLFHATF